MCDPLYAPSLAHKNGLYALVFILLLAAMAPPLHNYNS